MKNYNEIISSLREIARDQIRMKAINRVRTVLLNESQTRNQLKENLTTLKLELATNEYELTTMDANHPKHEKRLERKNKDIENIKATIEEAEKDIVEQEKVIADVNKNIDEITKGEYKVNKEDLECVTNGLVEQVIREHAKNIEISDNGAEAEVEA